MHRAIAVVLIVLLLTGQTGSILEIDTDHSLNSPSAIGTYRDQGVVSARMNSIDLLVTISASHEDVDRSGLHSDTANTYVRFQYHEETPRTVRIYISSEYFTPRKVVGLRAVDTNVTADVVSANGSRYTSITVHFDGETDAVFKMTREAGIVFGRMNEYRNRTETVTGWDIPNPFAGADWNYVEPAELNETNTSIAVRHPKEEELMLEYDAGRDERYWLATPPCEGQDIAVCRRPLVHTDPSSGFSPKSSPCPQRVPQDGLFH